MIDPLVAELRTNVRRYEANIAELKWLLLYLGDEPGAQLADWDWRWPNGATLEPVVRHCFDDPRWRESVSPQVAERLDRLYRVLADQPPSMEEWAEQWEGNSNLFYVFMFEKLDRLSAEVSTLATEVEYLIHKSSPKPGVVGSP